MCVNWKILNIIKKKVIIFLGIIFLYVFILLKKYYFLPYVIIKHVKF
jgi:hypothetical protein